MAGAGEFFKCWFFEFACLRQMRNHLENEEASVAVTGIGHHAASLADGLVAVVAQDPVPVVCLFHDHEGQSLEFGGFDFDIAGQFLPAFRTSLRFRLFH